MFLKNSKFPFLLLFIPGISLAQNSFSDSYKVGDKLYVYSRDGLSLREDADQKGKLISVAIYGDELIVLSDDKPRVSFTSTNIPGAWVKVKSKDKTGYMSNGFLSRLKPMPLSPPDKAFDSYEKYLKEEFKLLRETNTPPDPKPQDYVQHYNTYGKIDFANGTIHQSTTYEGGASIVTKFPIKAFTFQEVFLLARIAYPEFFSQKKCDYKVNDMACELDEYHSLVIKRDADFFVVFYGMAD